ncbi:MAG: hypothetical protein P8129_21330 [Anaerolineae bacterium]
MGTLHVVVDGVGWRAIGVGHAVQLGKVIQLDVDLTVIKGVMIDLVGELPAGGQSRAVRSILCRAATFVGAAQVNSDGNKDDDTQEGHSHQHDGLAALCLLAFFVHFLLLVSKS